GHFGRRILDIDYDTYAEGEAELGWLNSSVHISARKPFTLDEFLFDVTAELQQALSPLSSEGGEGSGVRGGEVAHLKAIGLADGLLGFAILVSTEPQPELSLASNHSTAEADVIVNARVAIDPAVLQPMVREALETVCTRHGATVRENKTSSFR